MVRLALLVAAVAVALPAIALGRLGVGVGTGKIALEQNLKPGAIYQLPSVTVINTGTEPAEYEMAVSIRENQEQLRPDPSWFTFSPARFQLEPGKAKPVDVSLKLPVKVDPGSYFAFLEAHPVQVSQGGSATIGIAAAAKLYYSVDPSSFFHGVYYRVASWVRHTAPWSYVFAAVLLVAALGVGLRRKFTFSLNVSKR